MTTSNQQPPAGAAHDDLVATTGCDERTLEALARSRELRARSHQLLGRGQTIAPAAAVTSRARRQAGTGGGLPGGQPPLRITALDQQVEYAKVTRARLAALAAELAATEDRVAYVHDQLAAEDPENAARYRRVADDARRAARRAREFQGNVTDSTRAQGGGRAGA